MSEIKVNKISPRTACGTTTLGDSGDTITIPAGVTITNSGTAAGFGATGAVSWDTTAKTTGFTAVDGVGYFVNTTAGAITVTLPLSPAAGAVIGVSDYAGTADTNSITIGRNGSNINGAAADLSIQQENSAITLVYVDGTQGWKATDTSSLSDVELEPAYVTATGGTISCSGDYRIHTFTGPGTFCVSALGNPVGGPNSVDYLVIAGGGSGGSSNVGGGGGAGGYRESSGAASGSYTASPLGSGVPALPVSVQGYPITVGGGGPTPNGNGNPSIFQTIISTAGGAGRGGSTTGNTGGSGGGGGENGGSGGAGNTPPVSPPQGRPGGASPDTRGGGGGGAAGPGCSGSPGPGGGGIGTGTQINPAAGTPGPSGPLKYFAGGGGGGSYKCGSCTPSGPGGYGGGGAGAVGGPGDTAGVAGTANTGGGGGGTGYTAGPAAGGAANGGSGIVVIRYKFQN